MIRLTHLPVLLILIASSAFTSPNAAAADQATQAQTDLPGCVTNTGVPSLLFDGMFGTIDTQGPYDTFKIDGAKIELMPSVTSGTNTIVFAQAAQSPDRSLTTVQFLRADATLAHACTVTLTTYDPARHDLAASAFGDCPFQNANGVTRIAPDRSTTFAVSSDLLEVVSAPRQIVDAVPISRQEIEVFGRSEGVGTLIWLGDDSGNGMLKGLCPITVTSDASEG